MLKMYMYVNKVTSGLVESISKCEGNMALVY